MIMIMIILMIIIIIIIIVIIIIIMIIIITQQIYAKQTRKTNVNRWSSSIACFPMHGVIVPLRCPR